MTHARLTVRQALLAARSRLPDDGDAQALAMHALGRSRSWLVAHADEPMPGDGLARLDALVARRQKGEPVAYLTGTKGFWSFDLEVTADTLVPRPETERLVEAALERLPDGVASAVIDLGTGTGAVALALAHERRAAIVTATDVSPAALDVARRNAQALGVALRLVEGDWLAAVPGERFDMIVSNPPYIEEDDPHLAALGYEPRGALVAGCDGLDDIRAIVSASPGALHPGGWLLFEHGWNQGEAVRALFGDTWQQVATLVDLEGRARVTCARLGQAMGS